MFYICDVIGLGTAEDPRRAAVAGSSRPFRDYGDFSPGLSLGAQNWTLAWCAEMPSNEQGFTRILSQANKAAFDATLMSRGIFLDGSEPEYIDALANIEKFVSKGLG